MACVAGVVWAERLGHWGIVVVCEWLCCFHFGVSVGLWCNGKVRGSVNVWWKRRERKGKSLMKFLFLFGGSRNGLTLKFILLIFFFLIIPQSIFMYICFTIVGKFPNLTLLKVTL